MDPLMTQLAALRLAPIQCVTWGHPVTSGLPTVDYFLSSELMEPKDGQDHYSERLIRLPGIGVCYAKPVIPRPLLNKTAQPLRSPRRPDCLSLLPVELQVPPTA